MHGHLTRYVKLRVAHAPGMPGTFPPPPRVSDPEMHHGTCVTHVPWCMLGSLTSGFLWSRHSRRLRNTQFYVSGKRPIPRGSTLYSEGSFVRRFFSPKPFEVAMVRRTYGPKVLYPEVPLLRKLLCSEDSIFRKALHYMDSMLRRFFSPKFI